MIVWKGKLKRAAGLTTSAGTRLESSKKKAELD